MKYAWLYIFCLASTYGQTGPISDKVQAFEFIVIYLQIYNFCVLVFYLMCQYVILLNFYCWIYIYHFRISVHIFLTVVLPVVSLLTYFGLISFIQTIFSSVDLSVMIKWYSGCSGDIPGNTQPIITAAVQC